MPYKRWKADDLCFLKQNYPIAPKEELESRLGRSFNRIKAKASELSIRRKQEPLSEETLRHLYCDLKLTTHVVAQQLHRSDSCICQTLRRYNIPIRAKGKRLWDQISHETLEDLYNIQGLSCPKIGAILSMSGATVRRCLTEYGIPLRSHSATIKSILGDSAHRQLASQNMKNRWQNPEYRAHQPQLLREVYQRNPELRHKKSCQSIDRWKDPLYVRNVLSGLQRKPTKPEGQLDAILTKHFPEFKYNGDGRLGIVLAGFIPDFVNVNGRKQVIEVFGSHWHDEVPGNWGRTEPGKKEAYNSIGFDCLVIWDYELKSEEQTIQKITTFMKEAQHAGT